MNYHLFALINGPAGRYDGLDDTLELAATWLLFALAALAAVPCVAALRDRRWAVLARVAAALVLAFAGGQVLARLSHQLRPFQTHPVHQLIAHDGGVSLPSDHATAAFALAFAVGAFLSWRWGAVLTVLAVVMGFARVWVGVHYPGDILAAAAIAGVAVLAVAVVARRFADRRLPARR